MNADSKIVRSLDELRAFAFDIAKDIEPGTILLLEGEMGSGKTQFTTYLVEALGGNETASPSFAIHNSYAVARGTVEHFDLFRVDDVDDLESTGFWDVFEIESCVVIEWSERLAGFGVMHQLPHTWRKKTLRFTIESDGSRVVRRS
ncbi:MAG: tRNA (adenosine(37)-N6)-threonylcarbamoyltransferase complex ATPase subunit type 1 TsaE [Bdellovibrionota bacterium]